MFDFYSKRFFRVSHILFLVIPILVGGCALGHRVVSLDYTPTTASSNKEGQPTVYVATIADTCPNEMVTDFIEIPGKEIGEIRNGYYMKTASVVAKETTNLSPWITDALVDELRHQGFQPVAVTSLPPDVTMGISGSLSECFSKVLFFKGQRCTLKATIAIYKKGVIVSNRQYIATYEKGLGLCSADEYEKIFQATMADLVGKIMKDIHGQMR